MFLSKRKALKDIGSMEYHVSNILNSRNMASLTLPFLTIGSIIVLIFFPSDSSLVLVIKENISVSWVFIFLNNLIVCKRTIPQIQTSSMLICKLLRKWGQAIMRLACQEWC
jgi:hypothetical protein